MDVHKSLNGSFYYNALCVVGVFLLASQSLSRSQTADGNYARYQTH